MNKQREIHKMKLQKDGVTLKCCGCDRKVTLQNGRIEVTKKGDIKNYDHVFRGAGAIGG